MIINSKYYSMLYFYIPNNKKLKYKVLKRCPILLLLDSTKNKNTELSALANITLIFKSSLSIIN